MIWDTSKAYLRIKDKNKEKKTKKYKDLIMTLRKKEHTQNNISNNNSKK